MAGDNKELIDILDENGMKTGEIVSRSEVHKKGLWHRAILIAIVNEKNEILLQKRSKNKEKNAGMWDLSVAGHVTTGQDAVSSAAREINEEVSINLSYIVNVKDFRFLFSYRSQVKYSESFIENQFYDFFVLRVKIEDIKEIKIQESEVEEIKFVNISELRDIIENNLIVDRGKVYDELIDYLHRY